MLADEDRNRIDRLDDYGTDALGKLIYQVQTIQKNGLFDILSDEDIDKLHELRKNRNYWSHECFNGYVQVVFRKGDVKRSERGKRLLKDFEEAVEWDEKLTRVFRRIGEIKDLRKGLFTEAEVPIVITGAQFAPLTDDKSAH